jgi:hypothetical protein
VGAHQTGQESFEQHGHRMIAEVLVDGGWRSGVQAGEG